MAHRTVSPTTSSGFSLLELAVVLSIIGLLLGAVFGGRNLIKQSELQSIISDFGKYSTAVAQFRQQYGGLPGDILDATSFWGDDNAVCADAAIDNGSPGTCNGNNNNSMADSAEPYRAWQHLVLAKLIEGNFTGVAGGTPAADPGVNVPRGKMLDSGWSFGYKATTAADANWYDQDLSNYLVIGKKINSAAAITQGPLLSTEDALQTDKKMDDGLPASGRVIAMKPAFASTPNCSTSATDASAAYKLTTKGPQCSLHMSLTSK